MCDLIVSYWVLQSKQNDHHFFPRLFIFENVPQLKYHNPHVTVTVDRKDVPTSTIRFTLGQSASKGLFVPSLPPLLPPFLTSTFPIPPLPSPFLYNIKSEHVKKPQYSGMLKTIVCVYSGVQWTPHKTLHFFKPAAVKKVGICRFRVTGPAWVCLAD